jgi:hypothetical protein
MTDWRRFFDPTAIWRKSGQRLSVSGDRLVMKIVAVIWGVAEPVTMASRSILHLYFKRRGFSSAPHEASKTIGQSRKTGISDPEVTDRVESDQRHPQAGDARAGAS